MAQITTTLVTAGAVTAIAWQVLAGPSAMDVRSVGLRAVDPAALTTERIDRSHKGDRLVATHPAQAKLAISTVEIGTDKAIVLRAADGSVLFGADPAARLTSVAKNAVLPELTLQGAPASPLQATRNTVNNGVPSDAPQAGDTRRPDDIPQPRPAGCDPAFSPVAAPGLDHIFGRCVTAIPGNTKVAWAQ